MLVWFWLVHVSGWRKKHIRMGEASAHPSKNGNVIDGSASPDPLYINFIEKFQQAKLLQNWKDFLTNDKAGTGKTW